MIKADRDAALSSTEPSAVEKGSTAEGESCSVVE